MTDAETIADLERQVATLQQQLRVENNRRRHLEVKAKITPAGLLQSRSYGGGRDLRAELYGSRKRGDEVEQRRAECRWRPARWLRGAGHASLAPSDNEGVPRRPPIGETSDSFQTLAPLSAADVRNPLRRLCPA